MIEEDSSGGGYNHRAKRKEVLKDVAMEAKCNEEENFMRLGQLLLGSGQDVLRQFLSDQLSRKSSSLENHLDEHKDSLETLHESEILSKTEMDLLFPTDGSCASLEAFDSKLLMCILSNTFELQLKVSNILDELFQCGQQLSQYSDKTAVDDCEFNVLWNKTTDIITDLTEHSSKVQCQHDLKQKPSPEQTVETASTQVDEQYEMEVHDYTCHATPMFMMGNRERFCHYYMDSSDERTLADAGGMTKSNFTNMFGIQRRIEACDDSEIYISEEEDGAEFEDLTTGDKLGCFSASYLDAGPLADADEMTKSNSTNVFGIQQRIKACDDSEIYISEEEDGAEFEDLTTGDKLEGFSASYHGHFPDIPPVSIVGDMVGQNSGVVCTSQLQGESEPEIYLFNDDDNQQSLKYIVPPRERNSGSAEDVRRALIRSNIGCLEDMRALIGSLEVSVNFGSFEVIVEDDGRVFAEAMRRVFAEAMRRDCLVDTRGCLEATRVFEEYWRNVFEEDVIRDAYPARKKISQQKVRQISACDAHGNGALSLCWQNGGAIYNRDHMVKILNQTVVYQDQGSGNSETEMAHLPGFCQVSSRVLLVLFTLTVLYSIGIRGTRVKHCMYI